MSESLSSGQCIVVAQENAGSAWVPAHGVSLWGSTDRPPGWLHPCRSLPWLGGGNRSGSASPFAGTPPPSLPLILLPPPFLFPKSRARPRSKEAHGETRRAEGRETAITLPPRPRFASLPSPRASRLCPLLQLPFPVHGYWRPFPGAHIQWPLDATVSVSASSSSSDLLNRTHHPPNLPAWPCDPLTLWDAPCRRQRCSPLGDQPEANAFPVLHSHQALLPPMTHVLGPLRPLSESHFPLMVPGSGCGTCALRRFPPL